MSKQNFCLRSIPDFLLVGLNFLTGLCNTVGRGEVQMNLMPPPMPKIAFFPYFVSSERLLLEGL
jgi:hypothetical protein